ncbi:MAG: TRAP transporter small permease [Arcanobacterium sp.]|nr:TRAP transporter small permease [Arcanobacterium sp.]
MVNKIFRLIEIVMAVFLVIMVAFMFLNVVMRFAFDSGLVWSEEIARLAFIFLVYLGIIGAYRDNRHLGVNMLMEKLPERYGKIIFVVIQLIVIWVMVLLAIGSINLAEQTLNDRWVATQFPRWIVSGVGAVPGIAVSFLALTNIYRVTFGKAGLADLLVVENDDSAADLTTSEVEK